MPRCAILPLSGEVAIRQAAPWEEDAHIRSLPFSFCLLSSCVVAGLEYSLVAVLVFQALNYYEGFVSVRFRVPEGYGVTSPPNVQNRAPAAVEGSGEPSRKPETATRLRATGEPGSATPRFRASETPALQKAREGVDGVPGAVSTHAAPKTHFATPLQRQETPAAANRPTQSDKS